MDKTLKLKAIKKNTQEYYNFKTQYLEAFPSNERIPRWLLRLRSNSKHIDFLAIYNDQKQVGFTYLISKNNLTFVLYLAIDSSTRGHGYGSLALKAIANFKSHNRIFLNIEALDISASNYNQRVKRKAFYLKNQYFESNISTSDFGNTYELLIYNNGSVTFEEYRSLLKLFATPILGPFIMLFTNRIKSTN